MANTDNNPRVFDPAKAGLLNTMLTPTQLFGTAAPAPSSVNATFSPLQNTESQLKESQEAVRLREENKAAQAAQAAPVKDTGAAANVGDFNTLMSNFMQSMQALAPPSAPSLDQQAASANAMAQQAQRVPDLTQDQLNRMSSSWQAQRLIEADSPLLGLAQNRAAQGANARGLLNSTAAINAGTQAMLAEAGNFGKADAQTYGQALQNDRAIDARAREAYANASFEDARSQRAAEQAYRDRLGQSGASIFQGLVNNELTLERDARQNAFTLDRDALQNQYQTARDATSNEFTLRRDELASQLGIKRATVDAELQASRDAVLYAQQMGRDATQAEYARLAAAQAAKAQLERDAQQNVYQTTAATTEYERQVELVQLASTLKQKEAQINAELQAARDEVLYQQQLGRDASQAQYARVAAAENAKYQLERDALALQNEIKIKELEFRNTEKLVREKAEIDARAEQDRLATMQKNQLSYLAAQNQYQTADYNTKRTDALSDKKTADQDKVLSDYQAYNQKINTDLSRDIARVRTSGDSAEVKRAQIKALQDAADSAIDNNNKIVQQNPNWVKEWALYDFVPEDIAIADDKPQEYDFKDIIGNDGFSNDSERMAAFDEANRRGLTLDQLGAITKFPVSDMRAWLQSKGLMLDADAKRDGVSKPGDGVGPIGGGTGSNPTLSPYGFKPPDPNKAPSNNTRKWTNTKTGQNWDAGAPGWEPPNGDWVSLDGYATTPVEPRPTTTNPGTGGLLTGGGNLPTTIGQANDPGAQAVSSLSTGAQGFVASLIANGWMTPQGTVVPGNERKIYDAAKAAGIKGADAAQINAWARANDLPELT